MDEYIKQQNEKQKAATLAALETVQQENSASFDTAQNTSDTAFQNAMLAMFRDNQQRTAETNAVLRANDLNEGAGSQAALSQGNTAAANEYRRTAAKEVADRQIALARKNSEEEAKAAVQQAIAKQDYNAANQLYTNFQEERSLAQSQVDTLVSAGVMPDSETVGKSGYSSEYVSARYNKVMAQKAAAAAAALKAQEEEAEEEETTTTKTTKTISLSSIPAVSKMQNAAAQKAAAAASARTSAQATADAVKVAAQTANGSMAGAVWNNIRGMSKENTANYLDAAKALGAIDDKQYKYLSTVGAPSWMAAPISTAKILSTDNDEKIDTKTATAVAISAYGGTPVKLPTTVGEAKSTIANGTLYQASQEVAEIKAQALKEYQEYQKQTATRVSDVGKLLTTYFNNNTGNAKTEQEYTFVLKYLETGNAQQAYAYVTSRTAEEKAADEAVYAEGIDATDKYMLERGLERQELDPNGLEVVGIAAKYWAQKLKPMMAKLAGAYAAGQQMKNANNQAIFYGMFNQDTAKAQYDFFASVANEINETTTEYAIDCYLAANADMQAAMEYASAGDQLLFNLVSVGLDIVTDAAVNFVLPGAALLSMGVRVFGTSEVAYEAEGYDPTDAGILALKDATIEVATELIGGAFSKVYGKGALGRLTDKLTAKFEEKTLLNVTTQIMLAGAGEGAEELIGGIADEFATRLLGYDETLGKVITEDEWADIIYNGMIGFIMGTLGGAGSVATATIKEGIKPQQTEAIADAAISNALKIMAVQGKFSAEALQAMTTAAQNNATYRWLNAEGGDVSTAPAWTENARQQMSMFGNPEVSTTARENMTGKIQSTADIIRTALGLDTSETAQNEPQAVEAVSDEVTPQNTENGTESVTEGNNENVAAQEATQPTVTQVAEPAAQQEVEQAAAVQSTEDPIVSRPKKETPVGGYILVSGKELGKVTRAYDGGNGVLWYEAESGDTSFGVPWYHTTDFTDEMAAINGYVGTLKNAAQKTKAKKTLMDEREFKYLKSLAGNPSVRFETISTARNFGGSAKTMHEYRAYGVSEDSPTAFYSLKKVEYEFAQYLRNGANAETETETEGVTDLQPNANNATQQDVPPQEATPVETTQAAEATEETAKPQFDEDGNSYQPLDKKGNPIKQTVPKAIRSVWEQKNVPPTGDYAKADTLTSKARTLFNKAKRVVVWKDGDTFFETDGINAFSVTEAEAKRCAAENNAEIGENNTVSKLIKMVEDAGELVTTAPVIIDASGVKAAVFKTGDTYHTYDYKRLEALGGEALYLDPSNPRSNLIAIDENGNTIGLLLPMKNQTDTTQYDVWFENQPDRKTEYFEEKLAKKEQSRAKKTAQSTEVREDGLGAANKGFSEHEMSQGEQWVAEAQNEGDDTIHTISNEQLAAVNERGEMPQDVPKVDLNGHLTSKTVSTITNSGITPQAMTDAIIEDAAQGKFSHIPYADKAAIEKAEADIANVGWDNALASFKAKATEGIGGKDMAVMGITLYNNAVNSQDYATAMDVLSLLVKVSTSNAQGVQAMRILNKLSPDSKLYNAMKSVEFITEEIKKKFGLDEDIQIDPDLISAYRDALQSGDKAAIKEAWGNIQQNIADQIPPSWADKLNAWRYLSMLGNTRTHVRNISGNLGFVPVRAIKNVIATALEIGVDKISGGKINRTKAFLNPASASDRALIVAAWGDYESAAEAIMSNGKFNDLPNTINDRRRIFKLKNLEGARKVNFKALNKEDQWFSQPAYTAALAGYLKANNISAQEYLNGNLADDAMAEAQAYAVKEAQKATYRDLNRFSDAITSITRYAERKGGKAAEVLIEGTVPFKKTPANILARAVEYSPVGLTAYLTEGSVRLAKGEITAAQFIDGLASGLTGTGILALGFMLAHAGVLFGGGDDDELEELQGVQDYSVTLFGKNFTLDWLAPEALPLFVGVELYNNWLNGEGNGSVWDFFDSLTNLAEPMTEMSMLQGVNDLIGTVKYADNPLAAIGVGSAASYISQFIPTSFGQIERAFTEDKRESTFIDKASETPSSVQYWVGKALNKIPGAEYQQIDYADVWGRTESTGTLLERIANNFANPAYESDIRTEEVETELNRLAELGYDVMPSKPGYDTQISGEYLTAEQYQAYTKRVGQLKLSTVTKLTQSDAYAALSNADKAEAIADCYTYATGIANLGIDSNADVASWITSAKEYGNPAEYIAVRTATGNLTWEKGENGAKKQAYIDYINSLEDLSAEQKAKLFHALNPDWKTDDIEWTE